MQHISKTFPGVRALDDVSISVETGCIHAICGENGAGKSTLMKVLSRASTPTAPTTARSLLRGEPVRVPHHQRHGGGRHRHHPPGARALALYLSIAENIYLGNEKPAAASSTGTRRTSKRRQLLQKVGLRDNPITKIIDLGVGKQQLVEIAKALSKRGQDPDPRRADGRAQRRRLRLICST